MGFASTDWSYATKPRQPGGAGYYRCALPARALAELGHETFHGLLAAHADPFEFCVETADGVIHDSLDIIILQRYMGGAVEADLARAQANGQIVVNDLDDWYFGLDPSNRAFWHSHPKVAPDVNRNYYQRILARSDALICSTPYLAERFAKLLPGQRIITIRNAIDLARWTPQTVRDTSDELVVGWVGATPWRSGDLELLRGVLNPWLRRHGARFYHGGHTDKAPKAGQQLGLTRDYDSRALCPIELYPDLFEGIDIGIAPMRDTPFNHAKSAIKGMEYAAAGVPYVASATPEYAWFGAGLLARRAHDWTRHLTTMLDPATRRRLAGDARKRVEQEDITRRGIDWERALLSLAPHLKKVTTSGLPEAVGRH